MLISAKAEHAGYLVSNLDLPGFTPAQRRLLAVLLRNQSGPLDIHSLNQQNALTPREAGCLCRLLRLAIILPAAAVMTRCRRCVSGHLRKG